MSYNPSTDQGKVRLLISDTDVTNEVYQDAEIQAFLDLNDGNVFRSAASALRAIASNEAQVLKVMRLMELQTDGAKLAQALQSLARDYDERAKTRGKFAIAELAIPPFGVEQRIFAELQRAST